MTRLNNINIAKFWRHFASFFTTMWRVEGRAADQGRGGGGGWQLDLTERKTLLCEPPGYCQFYFCSCLNLSGPYIEQQPKIGRYSIAQLLLTKRNILDVQLKNDLEPI